MSIRPFLPADAERVVELIRELAVYERLEHLMETTPDMLREQVAREDNHIGILVAEANDGIVGYAIYFRTYSTFLGKSGHWLEDLYVTPSHRGTGLGKRLLLEVAQVAKNAGSARLEWAVLDWNQPAIDFYERIGADVMPDWRICRLVAADLEKICR